MKILKGISIFVVFVALLESCTEQPNFSNTPQFEVANLEFVETPGAANEDSLIVYLEFKDGNGDLGLGTQELSPPYNDKFLFLEDGLGNVTKIPTNLEYSDLPTFAAPNGATGKLVSIRTRQKTEYNFLPAYSCEYYTKAPICISGANASMIDPSYYVIDTLNSGPLVYILSDSIYYEKNPYTNNIEVDWLVKNTDGTFTEFDWFKEFDCSTTFDGRYPILFSSDNGKPLEGTLKYGMTSTGFIALFGTKVLKLRILMRDRALNEYVSETSEFTIDEIRKN